MILREDGLESVEYNRAEYPIYIAKGPLSNYVNYSAPTHWHDDIEFIYVFEGKMDYSVNGEIVPLKAGEGIVINSRQVHFGFSKEKNECDFYCVLLHPILLCTNSAFEKRFVLPVLESGMPFIELSEDIPWEGMILREIKELYENRNSESLPLRAEESFFKIWRLFFDNLPLGQRKKEMHSGDLTTVKNMMSFVQNNFQSKITLSEIAKSGLVGESKCCKLFKKYLNQTPNSYLTDYRIFEGMKLLSESDLSVTEIAFSVGFSSASYFAETFRLKTGKSPASFRKEKRNIL